MITEQAILPVLPGREADFEDAFRQARPLISGMAGFLGLELLRSRETPHEYLLLVRWETVEHHTEGFRGSPEYARWKALLHDFYAPFPRVEHFVEVTS
ncbi:antibiotic biosynthesis monooxygenase family protein [Nesterenkonia xinjiangensis]|uniref:Heme-degrading monooxygenase HmoA n=1 Tax=Nesterenkonia xinjiangensis TaxID=225327 RepID=A0A7Z0KAC0_9MICC|nr:antibiotic biosynthesis monooxygenase [Nesterenkonia xinjiangensis]NYJ78125.1 heme-degrading monooxygenase HmoA [Nesterenkonia xinjiangensis]